ncbi:hypothetical protein H4R19_003325 [Coemansia spiralis]|nr:hypothetical protein H4R19_003325 [Coemansia spiralis]
MPQITPGEAAAHLIQRTPTVLSSYSKADTVVDACSRPSNRTALVALKAEEETGPASTSEQLVDWALRACNLAAGDTVVLVNVRSEIASAKSKAYSTHVATYASIYDAEEREKSLRLLHTHQDSLHRRGFQCRVLALAGDKREQIVAAAAREHADCIVVGQPRRHLSLIPTKRPLATALVQLADIPVTVAPLRR